MWAPKTARVMLALFHFVPDSGSPKTAGRTYHRSVELLSKSRGGGRVELSNNFFKIFEEFFLLSFTLFLPHFTKFYLIWY